VAEKLDQARDTLIQGMSRISQFWGFPRGMGAIFGALYLSPQPLSLDDLVAQVEITKGAVSTNVRALERLGMVHPHLHIGERKDFYVAETDFWKIARGILKEREKAEFDQALRSVGESIQIVEAAQAANEFNPEEARQAVLYQQRLRAMQNFFHTLDNLVAAFLALDEFRLSSLQKLLGVTGK
jgi:HTH-type transcriptional regulator, glycine betaine synthesis regulator